MNTRRTPTTQLRWIDKQVYQYDSNDGKTITVLEQWHQNEVLTETHGWQPVNGGEWKEIKKENNSV